MENSELAKKAVDGDLSAFSDLYSFYYKDLYKFAFYYLGNYHDAEDAVSDAVCGAVASLKSLKNPNAFKSWMFTILSRTCKRKIKYIISARKAIDLEDIIGLCDSGDFTEALEVRQEIYKLNYDERNIILLSVVAGYTSSEISEILKCNASTVRSKLSRSLKKLEHCVN